MMADLSEKVPTKYTVDLCPRCGEITQNKGICDRCLKDAETPHLTTTERESSF